MADPRPPPASRDVRVVFVVALVCAVAVCGATVALRPRQQEHQRRERQARLREVVASLPGAAELLADARGEVQARVIDLATGRDDPSVDPATFDARAAAADPARSVAIPPADDLAGLGRRATHGLVWRLLEGERVRTVVLPVEGSGYGGPIRGFVALEGDGNTVLALSFFEHQETPGIGARLEEASWRARWRGKTVRDADGRLRIGVASEAPTREDAPHQVDAITGATVTSDAVGALLRYWLGDHGYGPFLARLRAEAR